MYICICMYEYTYILQFHEETHSFKVLLLQMPTNYRGKGSIRAEKSGRHPFHQGIRQRHPGMG